jgi:glycosyltransferase involved in cell wall biosynthesis
MGQRRKSIFIISFSNIRSDARVLRQIQYLSTRYDLTVLGHGEPHPVWKDKENVKWLTALPISPIVNGLKGKISRLKDRALIVTGKLLAGNYDRMYWSQPAFKDALSKALESGCDAFHANDWNTLPIASEAARRLGARLIFDAHEYSPVEFEEQFAWRLFFAPMIRHILREYAVRADATITVAPALAERYRQEFGLDPMVILNAPRRVEVQKKERDFKQIRLIYHGCAMRDRRIENMIRALALCDNRYSLHLMLTGHAPDYFQELKTLGDELAPGRLVFHDPVSPEQVVQQISAFDMGFCYMIADNFNYLAALPNKFFECIVAGLPICVGPSLSMAEIVKSYGLGCVAPSFEPEAFAATLNSLKTDELAAMQQHAIEASSEINADREMGKLVELYQRLLSEKKLEL